MSAFAEFLAQIVQQQADHNRRAAEVTRKPHAAPPRIITRSPEGMPVYDKADPLNRTLQAMKVQEYVERREPVPTHLLEGLQPDDIVSAYAYGTASAGMGPPLEPGPVAPRPAPQVSPDALYVPGKVGEVDPRYEPGTKSHPVERAYGRTDSIVQQLATPEHPAGRYVPQLFEHAEGVPMAPHEAAQLIAGQLAARRMRVLGSQDPSVGREYLDPLIMDLTKSPTL